MELSGARWAICAGFVLIHSQRRAALRTPLMIEWI
ncbi:hypothetical protein HNR02_006344 [Amycolatopsis endophytica]|uniref:Uncharacterized protein n=1 Tax=Amycolatopsis endophytica TaxID=860233 RepID=A0A853BCP3_9PSEU|nr:hypothetical protein [Amycolatopsis endophytica]